MGHTTGRLKEIRIDPSGIMEWFIACPPNVIPVAGQYLLAHDQEEPHSILNTPLFLTEKSSHGFWAVSPFPGHWHPGWQPGTSLDLVGPLGHGFALPRAVQRLGLVALDGTVARLLPLVILAVENHSAVTLFTDQRQSRLPSVLEIYPLASLPDILEWADFIALDVSLDHLANIRDFFGLAHSSRLPCPAQVLVTTAMPCGGIAQCGACAVKARRGWKLACEDGPVFDLDELDW